MKKVAVLGSTGLVALVLAAVAPISPTAHATTTGVILTAAGTGTAGFNGDNQPATAAQLNGPAGVALDSSGDLLVADTANNRVRMVTPGGTISTVAGTGTAGYNGDNIAASTAQLNAPSGVAVDGSGNVLIADTANNRVRKVTTSTGVISTVAGTGTAGFNGDNQAPTAATLNGPASVAVNSSGDLLIADTANNRVRTVTAGKIQTVAGNGVGGFNGDNIPASTAELNAPSGVAADASNNVLIADTHNNRVRSVSSGVLTTVAGNGTAGFNGDNQPATSAQLSGPSGIALDGSGNLLIADTTNNRVRKVTGGTIFTVAGNGTAGFNGDSQPATTAALNAPSGVAVSGSGDFLIGDTANNRVRTVTHAEPTPCAAPSISGGTATVTCNYTGGFQAFKVPSGVTSMTIDASGAQGGAGAPGIDGGKGAELAGAFAVTPGETLSVVVGGSGGTNASTVGSGGGASFVYRTATTGGLLVGAAGGGGGGDSLAGSPGSATTTASNGGGCGGAAGTNGGGGDGGCFAPSGGGGGGLLTDGNSGVGAFAAGGQALANGAAGGGGAVSGGFGGGGGGAHSGSIGGGGGGGGYNGGGGGAASGCCADGPGGGGGSFIASAATSTSGTDGVRAGNGLVTFRYLLPTTLAVTKGGPSSALPGSNITYNVSVTNSGTVPAVNAAMTDALPSGTTFVSASQTTPTTGWTCGATGNHVTCTNPSLAVGTATFAIVAHVSASTTGTLSNVASASADNAQLVTSAPATVTTIGADHTQGSTGGNVTVGPGSTLISGAAIGGSLTIPAGATVVLTNSTVGGSITATDPGSVTICGTTVGNAVKVSGASGFVLLGDPGDDGCASNTFRAGVTLTSNTGAAELVGNHIGANTSVTGTTGKGPFPEDQGAELEGNTIGGTFACGGNTPISNDGHPNSATGARSGQCTGGF